MKTKLVLISLLLGLSTLGFAKKRVSYIVTTYPVQFIQEKTPAPKATEKKEVKKEEQAKPKQEAAKPKQEQAKPKQEQAAPKPEPAAPKQETAAPKQEQQLDKPADLSPETLKIIFDQADIDSNGILNEDEKAVYNRMIERARKAK